MSAQAQELTIRKEVTVDCSPEQAFETYTERISSWWPLETHSVGGGSGTPPEEVVLEPHVGGRFYERSASGEEHEWARVLVWEPPHRLVVDWHVNPESPATELEVTFTPEGGKTRVELEHRGWERYGDMGKEASGDYSSGWEQVLGRFVDAADA